MRKLKYLRFCGVILLIFILSCNTTSPLSVRVQERIDAGKNALKANDFRKAMDKFREALDLDPDNPNANFGFILASIFDKINELNELMIQLINLLSTVGLGDLVESTPSQSPALAPQSEGVYPESVTWGRDRSGLNLLLFSLLSGNLLSFIEYTVENLSLIEKQGSLNFYLEDFIYEINLAGVVYFKMDLSGEYDLGEVYFIDFILRLLDALLKIVLSPDYQISLSTVTTVLNYVNSSDWSNRLATNSVDAIRNLIAVILNSEPHLLDFEPSEGKALLTDAANWMQEAFAKARLSLQYIFSETDPQDDDVLAYDPNKENTLLMPGVRDGEFVKYEVELPPNFLDSLQHIEQNLSGDSSVRISWVNDIAPILAVVAYTVLASGMFDAILDMMIEGIEDPSTVEFIRSFLDPGTLSVKMLQGIITVVIGDIFELDLGTFLREPTPIRALLPAWTDESDPSKDTLVFEWECPSYSLDAEMMYLLCLTGTATDSPHFVGPYSYASEITGARYPAPISADGLDSDIPYIAWQSPDFGRLLYINYYNLNPQKESVCGRAVTPDVGFHRPDLCEINAFTVDLLQDLINAVRQGFSTSSPP